MSPKSLFSGAIHFYTLTLHTHQVVKVSYSELSSCLCVCFLFCFVFCARVCVVHCSQSGFHYYPPHHSSWHLIGSDHCHMQVVGGQAERGQESEVRRMSPILQNWPHFRIWLQRCWTRQMCPTLENIHEGWHHGLLTYGSDLRHSCLGLWYT